MHKLVAEQSRGRVSRVDCGEETTRHTYWWQNRVAVRSAGWIAGRRRDDAHTGGGTAPREDKSSTVSLKNHATHILKTTKCHTSQPYSIH